MCYLDGGRMSTDNNLAERLLRGIALTRKNYLIVGSDVGGERAASIYTIAGTAKLNGLIPEAYIAAIAEPPRQRSSHQQHRRSTALDLQVRSPARGDALTLMSFRQAPAYISSERIIRAASVSNILKQDGTRLRDGSACKEPCFNFRPTVKWAALSQPAGRPAAPFLMAEAASGSEQWESRLTQHVSNPACPMAG
jgi:hypothetical protein